MARINVNPTRMELAKLKKKLNIAIRGHKLLKDKQDELIRQFISLVNDTKQLREHVESSLTKQTNELNVAEAMLDSSQVAETLVGIMPKIQYNLTIKNIMSVRVPIVNQIDKKTNDLYSYLTTNDAFDTVITTMNKLQESTIELAVKEKQIQLLACEIERTRRRVNALEQMSIPNLEETIKFIQMKLEEAERASIARLMKVKDLVK